ncbi:MAG: hypothetical protein JW936_01600 [Sedimentisphaerales bacterium]|nr:hypothetical protein [Sedimentisphaerales bacterium]
MKIKKPGWLIFALIISLLMMVSAANEGWAGVSIGALFWMGVAIYFAISGKD